MTDYRVVALDINDTLLNSGNVISEETTNYLTTIQDEGYYVVLASDRPTEGMIPTAGNLKLPGHHSYIISYNGSKTINMTNEGAEVSRSIGKQDFDETVDHCRDRSFFVLTHHDGQIIYDSEHEYMNIEAELIGLPTKHVDDIKAYIQDDVPEVTGVGCVASIAEAKIDSNGVFNGNVDATAGKPFFLGFMTKGVSRGNAIKALRHRLECSVDQATTFGDSTNDKSMFEVAGLTIAMGNVSDELKQYVNEVTLDHNEDGIPHTLKKLL